MILSCTISEIFYVEKWRAHKIWVKTTSFDKSHTSSYSSSIMTGHILYLFRDKAIYWWKITIYCIPLLRKNAVGKWLGVFSRYFHNRTISLTCATHTPHNSWRSLISGGCRTSMEHSTTTGSGRAFSSCLSTGTKDCAVPVVLSG